MSTSQIDKLHIDWKSACYCIQWYLGLSKQELVRRFFEGEELSNPLRDLCERSWDVSQFWHYAKLAKRPAIATTVQQTDSLLFEIKQKLLPFEVALSERVGQWHFEHHGGLLPPVEKIFDSELDARHKEISVRLKTLDLLFEALGDEVLTQLNCSETSARQLGKTKKGPDREPDKIKKRKKFIACLEHSDEQVCEAAKVMNKRGDKSRIETMKDFLRDGAEAAEKMLNRMDTFERRKRQPDK